MLSGIGVAMQGIPEEPEPMSGAEGEHDGHPGSSTGKTRPRSGDEGGHMGETSSEEGSNNNIKGNKSNKNKQAVKRMKVSSGPSQSY